MPSVVFQRLGLYAWSKICLFVYLNVIVIKEFAISKTEDLGLMLSSPFEIGLGWEKSLPWIINSTLREQLPERLRVQIRRTDKISRYAVGRKAQCFCKIQKVKLRLLKTIDDGTRKFYRADPCHGETSCLMLEILLLKGFLHFMVYKFRYRYRQIAWLAKKIVETNLNIFRGVIRSLMTSPNGVQTEIKEHAPKDALKSSVLVIIIGEDELSESAAEEDQTNSDSCGGGCAHEELVRKDRISEELTHKDGISKELAPTNEISEELAPKDGIGEEHSSESQLSGSRVGRRIKVSSSDGSFDEHVTNKTSVSKTEMANVPAPQKGASFAKRMSLEPAPKIVCGTKMARSIAVAGTRARSKPRWNR